MTWAGCNRAAGICPAPGEPASATPPHRSPRTRAARPGVRPESRPARATPPPYRQRCDASRREGSPRRVWLASRQFPQKQPPHACYHRAASRPPPGYEPSCSSNHPGRSKMPEAILLPATQKVRGSTIRNRPPGGWPSPRQTNSTTTQTSKGMAVRSSSGSDAGSVTVPANLAVIGFPPADNAAGFPSRNPHHEHHPTQQAPDGDEARLAIAFASSTTVKISSSTTNPASAVSSPRLARVSARLAGSYLTLI